MILLVSFESLGLKTRLLVSYSNNRLNYLFFQFGWLVGDNVTVNDVAVRHACKTLDPQAERLDAKEVQGRYVSYAFVGILCHSRTLFTAGVLNTPSTSWHVTL